MQRSRKISEHDLIQTFARTAKKATTRGVVVGIGDDAAVVRPRSGEDLVLTTDVMIEGRHFKRQWFSGQELGWRVAAVNLSDIAAMGAKPLYGLISLALPGDIDVAYVKEVERGIRDHLGLYGASIIGGNVSGIDGALVCDLTLVGSVAKGKAWRRSCRPGRDAIVVVGNLGEARAGLHMLDVEDPERPFRRLVQAYKKPKPLLEVADVLRNTRGIHGVIDVSDGFSTDLLHICEASGAGCEVELRCVPLSKTLQEFCMEHGKVPLQLALHGGEDYALIVSVDERKAESVVTRCREEAGVRATVIGRFTTKKRLY
ncbi:MAG: thiamine-phosphate kinase, partial [Candidatus Krumholzibacteria bacterium]|nr:thiamine-phosphate kinase [Candidatus Krumholzibacteria bacterium]